MQSTLNPMTTTTLSPMHLLLSLIKIPSSVTQIIFWGYLFTLLLGFTGNSLSFLTFIRPKLRHMSTGCLFILLAMSDTLRLLVFLADFLENGIRIPFYGHLDYDAFCRFRLFFGNLPEMYSSWLLVLITIDRWIRTRFPFKSKSICTRKNAFLIALIILLIFIGLNMHILFPFYGMALPGIPNLSCSAKSAYPSYYHFYTYQWFIIQLVFKCLAPTGLMIIPIIDMFVKIRAQKRAVHAQSDAVVVNEMTRRNQRMHNQMIILLLTNVIIFFATTLPLSFLKFISTRVAITISASAIDYYLVTSAVFNCLLSLNYAITFYIHCLTSTLFRKEFLQLINICHNPNGRQRNLSNPAPNIQH